MTSKRRQGKRGSQRDFDQRGMAGPRCPDCGKVQYLTKADAKRVGKRIKARTGKLDTYPCGTHWHLGHLPAPVIAGEMSRDDLADRRRTA